MNTSGSIFFGLVAYGNLQRSLPSRCLSRVACAASASGSACRPAACSMCAASFGCRGTPPMLASRSRVYWAACPPASREWLLRRAALVTGPAWTSITCEPILICCLGNASAGSELTCDCARCLDLATLFPSSLLLRTAARSGPGCSLRVATGTVVPTLFSGRYPCGRAAKAGGVMVSWSRPGLGGA